MVDSFASKFEGDPILLKVVELLIDAGGSPLHTYYWLGTAKIVD
ncbi:MAG: hypothetical protein RIG27_02045 [Coleofasciculus sp. F4-SAH-05]